MAERGIRMTETDTQPFPVVLVSADKRVFLRLYIPEDAPAAFALIDRNRAHLSRHNEPTALNYPTYERFERSITHSSNEKRLRFGIWNSDGDIVGSINLTPFYLRQSSIHSLH